MNLISFSTTVLFQMSLLLALLSILLGLGKGIELLKTLPFLKAKLQPLSKFGASKGSYLQDSFRTTQLIPSLQRINSLVFSMHGDFIHLKVVVISGYLIIAVIPLIVMISHLVNRTEVNKVSLQLENK